jgi:hypothetical protein
VLTRSLGARDLVIGAGLAVAAAHDRDPTMWLLGGVVADSVDGVFTLAAGDQIPATGGSPRRRWRPAPRSSAPGSRAPSIDPPDPRRSNTSFVRVAIIGSGISGLTAAHLLHPEHEIVVYEAGDHVGGHTNTIRVDTDDADLAHRHRLHRPQRPQLPALPGAPRRARVRASRPT